ncbi:hypothetical protein PCASD_01885 [Puccinia coronata f. sp. avenae]|uniref:Peptidase C19 ubiquitin carboxyl-terminal hydrolase domain-containing protein n=1 Tax=Puccinia coronata f. sp. avenae TaxID=200324 RepID=A0A2N5SX11_9BASI|nr:hypothetical protein PCASD_22106 [Puccinia coronata f. sp. avenae]PLW50184.1 hypothetical protein PCASD_01885 [Puccinia coronata f. sp. avenae]
MLSSGKKCMLLGMVELFAFVKVLQEDFAAVMRGVSIEYGSQTKSQTNIAQLMGWKKPRKRKRHKSANDGRAPDTTKALKMTDVVPKKERKKLGRPPGALNVDRNPFTTYPLYAVSKDPQQQNQCWMAAALESLYALYSPLWLRGTDGRRTDLFTSLVTHFASRSTYELTEAGSIRAVLTKGQNKIFKLLHEKYPDSFPPGRFALCNYFLEVSLETSRNLSRALRTLFAVDEARKLNFEVHPDDPQDRFWSRKTQQCLTIRKDLHELNNIPYVDVAKLIDQWTSAKGLQTSPGLYCRACHDDPNTQDRLPLSGTTCLELLDGNPPPHLYFAVETATIAGETQRRDFLGLQDWPF